MAKTDDSEKLDAKNSGGGSADDYTYVTESYTASTEQSIQKASAVSDRLAAKPSGEQGGSKSNTYDATEPPPKEESNDYDEVVSTANRSEAEVEEKKPTNPYLGAWKNKNAKSKDTKSKNTKNTKSQKDAKKSENTKGQTTRSSAVTETKTSQAQKTSATPTGEPTLKGPKNTGLWTPTPSKSSSQAKTSKSGKGKASKKKSSAGSKSGKKSSAGSKSGTYSYYSYSVASEEPTSTTKSKASDRNKSDAKSEPDSAKKSGSKEKTTKAGSAATGESKASGQSGKATGKQSQGSASGIEDAEREQRAESLKKKKDESEALDKKTMSEADLWSQKEIEESVSEKSIVKKEAENEEKEGSANDKAKKGSSEDEYSYTYGTFSDSGSSDSDSDRKKSKSKSQDKEGKDSQSKATKGGKSKSQAEEEDEETEKKTKSKSKVTEKDKSKVEDDDEEETEEKSKSKSKVGKKEKDKSKGEEDAKLSAETGSKAGKSGEQTKSESDYTYVSETASYSAHGSESSKDDASKSNDEGSRNVSQTKSMDMSNSEDGSQKNADGGSRAGGSRSKTDKSGSKTEDEKVSKSGGESKTEKDKEKKRSKSVDKSGSKTDSEKEDKESKSDKESEKESKTKKGSKSVDEKEEKKRTSGGTKQEQSAGSSKREQSGDRLGARKSDYKEVPGDSAKQSMSKMFSVVESKSRSSASPADDKSRSGSRSVSERDFERAEGSSASGNLQAKGSKSKSKTKVDYSDFGSQENRPPSVTPPPPPDNLPDRDTYYETSGKNFKSGGSEVPDFHSEFMGSDGNEDVDGNQAKALRSQRSSTRKSHQEGVDDGKRSVSVVKSRGSQGPSPIAEEEEASRSKGKEKDTAAFSSKSQQMLEKVAQKYSGQKLPDRRTETLSSEAMREKRAASSYDGSKSVPSWDRDEAKGKSKDMKGEGGQEQLDVGQAADQRSETTAPQELSDSSYDMGSKEQPSWDRSPTHESQKEKEPNFSDWKFPSSDGNPKLDTDRKEGDDTYRMISGSGEMENTTPDMRPEHSDNEEPKSGNELDNSQQRPSRPQSLSKSMTILSDGSPMGHSDKMGGEEVAADNRVAFQTPEEKEGDVQGETEARKSRKSQKSPATPAEKVSPKKSKKTLSPDKKKSSPALKDKKSSPMMKSKSKAGKMTTKESKLATKKSGLAGKKGGKKGQKSVGAKPKMPNPRVPTDEEMRLDAHSAASSNAQPFMPVQMVFREQPLDDSQSRSAYTLHSLGIGETIAKVDGDRFKHVKEPVFGYPKSPLPPPVQPPPPTPVNPEESMHHDCIDENQEGMPQQSPDPRDQSPEKKKQGKKGNKAGGKGRGGVKGRGKGKWRGGKGRGTGRGGKLRLSPASRSPSKSPGGNRCMKKCNPPLHVGLSTERVRCCDQPFDCCAAPLVQPVVTDVQTVGPDGVGPNYSFYSQVDQDLNSNSQNLGSVMSAPTANGGSANIRVLGSETTVYTKPEQIFGSPRDQVYYMTDDMYETQTPQKQSKPPSPRKQRAVQNAYITNYIDAPNQSNGNLQDGRVSPLPNSQQMLAEQSVYSNQNPYSDYYVKTLASETLYDEDVPSYQRMTRSALARRAANLGSQHSSRSGSPALSECPASRRTPYKTPRSPSPMAISRMRSTKSAGSAVSPRGYALKPTGSTASQTSPALRDKRSAKSALSPTVSVEDMNTGNTQVIHQPQNYQSPSFISKLNLSAGNINAPNSSLDDDNYLTARRSWNSADVARGRGQIRGSPRSVGKKTMKTKHLGPRNASPGQPAIPRLDGLASPRDFGEASPKSAPKKVSIAEEGVCPTCRQNINDFVCDSCRKLCLQNNMTKLCDACRRSNMPSVNRSCDSMGDYSSFCSVSDFRESCSICREKMGGEMPPGGVAMDVNNRSKSNSLVVRQIVSYGDENVDYASSMDLSPMSSDEPNFLYKCCSKVMEKIEQVVWGGDPAVTYLAPKREALIERIQSSDMNTPYGRSRSLNPYRMQPHRQIAYPQNKLRCQSSPRVMNPQAPPGSLPYKTTVSDFYPVTQSPRQKSGYPVNKSPRQMSGYPVNKSPRQKSGKAGRGTGAKRGRGGTKRGRGAKKKNR